MLDWQHVMVYAVTFRTLYGSMPRPGTAKVIRCVSSGSCTDSNKLDRPPDVGRDKA